MTKRFIKIFTTLTFAASAAFAQASVDAVFDGRGDTASQNWRSESVLPVIRETRESAPQPQPSLPPVRAAQEPDAFVQVALEVRVPAGSQPQEALAQCLSRLAIDYGFAPDTAFDPVWIPEFQILPYPPLPGSSITFLIRGVLPSGNVMGIRQYPSVRGVHEHTAGAKGVEELFLRHRGALLRIAGVRKVYIGLDCGDKEEHLHVLPHHTAIVIEIDGTLPVAAIRKAIFLELPELAVEPVRLQEAAATGSR